MNITRRELKSRAKMVLGVNYWPIFAALAIHSLLPALVSPSMNVMFYINNFPGMLAYILVGVVLLFTSLVSIFLVSPLYMAICRLVLKSSDDSGARLSEVWLMLKVSYFKLVKAGFMRDIFLVLWSVPYLAVVVVAAVMTQFVEQGILFSILFGVALAASIILMLYKSYSYSMVNFIMANDPDTGWREAIGESKKLMRGKTFFAFKLELSFIGWKLLGIMVCGIGAFFVQPYVVATQAQLYLALTQELNFEID